MRIRSLKPGFFKNEELCGLSAWHRICYAGLWCCADKEGRLEDRPKRLKAEIFPYDDLDMNSLLWDLMHAGFIVRYTAPNLQPLLWIPSWGSHQFPRSDEAESKYPPFTSGTERAGGPHVSTYPAFRPIETDPSLVRDVSASQKQIGSGVLDLGSGDWEHGTSAAPSAPSVCRAQDLIDLWNATTKPPLPRCRELTDDRRRKIRSRIAKRPDLGQWREAFEALQCGAFYCGDNARGWVANFDWLIKNDTVVAQVLERAQAVVARTPIAEWTCPDTPPCPAGTTAYDCEKRAYLEAGRKARAS